MGFSNLSQNQIEKILYDISREYVGTSYKLLTRNCNHFSEDLCKRLTGKSSPRWINRAAKLGTMFPCVIPTEWVDPPDAVSAVAPSDTAGSPSSLSYSSSTPLHTPKSKRAKLKKSKTSTTVAPTTSTATRSAATTDATAISTFDNQTEKISTGERATNITSTEEKPNDNKTTNSLNNKKSNSSLDTYIKRFSISSSRRPSGTESIRIARTIIIENDEPDSSTPVKEPDTHRSDVIRSATQLSITAPIDW
ncbi:PPPDE putative peptidase domain-containing protein [Mycotypha africana]|uniref:PPPDE putative peptidase domain-containing protein n=1 Tax=Mycotypha africana TaxID=64632 RepID=UPI002300B41C|nr:PPPDE putative peptidase domain-containing protein [Mycotypha africana]KAI8981762.1 PPPDE putative peptidase domain-containing protein [Mycotypha africana]